MATQSAPVPASSPRRRRLARPVKAVALAAVGIGAALGLLWVASPNNSWFLPGQTATVVTAVENHINGHWVMPGFTEDGSQAIVYVDGDDGSKPLSVGDKTKLNWGVTLTVVSIAAPPAPAPGEAAEDGGVGRIEVRVGIG